MDKNVTFVTKDVVIVLSLLAGLNTLSLIALAAVLMAYIKVRNKPGNFFHYFYYYFLILFLFLFCLKCFQNILLIINIFFQFHPSSNCNHKQYMMQLLTMERGITNLSNSKWRSIKNMFNIKTNLFFQAWKFCIFLFLYSVLKCLVCKLYILKY